MSRFDPRRVFGADFGGANGSDKGQDVDPVADPVEGTEGNQVEYPTEAPLLDTPEISSEGFTEKAVDDVNQQDYNPESPAVQGDGENFPLGVTENPAFILDQVTEYPEEPAVVLAQEPAVVLTQEPDISEEDAATLAQAELADQNFPNLFTTRTVDGVALANLTIPRDANAFLIGFEEDGHFYAGVLVEAKNLTEETARSFGPGAVTFPVNLRNKILLTGPLVEEPVSGDTTEEN